MEFYQNQMLKSNAISVYNGMIESLYYYSDHILMIDIQTDPIKHLPIKSLRSMKISVFNSKYRIDLEILAPANPNIKCKNLPASTSCMHIPCFRCFIFKLQITQASRECFQRCRPRKQK